MAAHPDYISNRWRPDQVQAHVAVLKTAEQVIAKLDADQTGAACNQLDAFISQVNGFISSGALTPNLGCQ